MKLDAGTKRTILVNSQDCEVFDDQSGTTYARICVALPSLTDPESVRLRKSYTDLDPVFVDDSTGLTRGWYVPVRELDKSAPEASAAPQSEAK